MHPERIPAILRLLRDLAVDPSVTAGPTNPLRQVIVNTHSPAVVGLVPDESLLFAANEPASLDHKRSHIAAFRWLTGTWRADAFPKHRTLSKGDLLSYLNPLGLTTGEPPRKPEKPPRVAERPDLQPLLPFIGTVAE
jgi:hypothetical protein